MSQYWLLGELLFLEEHWEWESSGVLSVNLFYLDSSVREEVVQDVVLVTTVVSPILPKDMEAQDFPVVVEEALQSLVWSATLQLDLDVVLHLSLVRWSLFEVDHGSGVSKQIFRVTLLGAENDTLVGVESPGKVIAVDNSENSLVDVEVDANVEVLPNVVFGLVIWVRQLVSLQEDSLRDTRILDSWLDDVDGVVIKVVVDDALPDSVVLVGVFDNWLLEVSVEAKDL